MASFVLKWAMLYERHADWRGQQHSSYTETGPTVMKVRGGCLSLRLRRHTRDTRELRVEYGQMELADVEVDGQTCRLRLAAPELLDCVLWVRPHLGFRRSPVDVCLAVRRGIRLHQRQRRLAAWHPLLLMIYD